MCRVFGAPWQSPWQSMGDYPNHLPDFQDYLDEVLEACPRSCSKARLYHNDLAAQIPQAEAADMGTSCTTISRKTLEVTGGTTDGTINTTTGTLQQLGPAQELEYTKKLSIAERCSHKDGCTG